MMVTMVTFFFFFLKGRTGKLGTNLFLSVAIMKNKSMLVASWVLITVFHSWNCW